MIFKLSIIACFASLLSLTLVAARKNKRNALVIVLSVVGITAGITTLALSAPRDVSDYGFDYIGVIVTILSALITLLVGMQLYNALRLKEDADEVSKAKEHVDKYAEMIDALKKQAEGISEMIDELNVKTEVLEEDIQPLNEIIRELQDKMKRAVLKDPYDGPDDDK